MLWGNGAIEVRIQPFNLTPEEQAWHDAAVLSGYSSVKNIEAEKKKALETARNTVAKNKAITIRMTERDHLRLKAAAAREGVPYQTLVTSLIHKHI